MRRGLERRPHDLLGQKALVVEGLHPAHWHAGSIGTVTRETEIDVPQKRKDVDREQQDDDRRDEDPGECLVRKAALLPTRSRQRERPGLAPRGFHRLLRDRSSSCRHHCCAAHPGGCLSGLCRCWVAVAERTGSATARPFERSRPACACAAGRGLVIRCYSLPTDWKVKRQSSISLSSASCAVPSSATT